MKGGGRAVNGGGKSGIAGRLSDLVLVRMHRRTSEYLAAADRERIQIAAACRRATTVDDLPERILGRTIYAQASSIRGPLRELVQNALDASPRGGRIHVRSSSTVAMGDTVVVVTDRGRGLTRTELVEDLIVPFRSGKAGDAEAIGEHGIGFLSVLEIAPCLEVATRAFGLGSILRVAPIGNGPPYNDFGFSLETLEVGVAPGTSVRLMLGKPILPATLAEHVATVAGLVDPLRASIFVNDVAINTVRPRLRRAASVTLNHHGEQGELELLVGRGDGIAPVLVVTQKGLSISRSSDAFDAPGYSLHKDLLRAVNNAGYGIVVDLPLSVPLTKGRSAVAASAAQATTLAMALAFERFILEDALHDRELLNGVDHRLSAILDRLVSLALAGDLSTPAPPPAELSVPPTLKPAVAPVEAPSPPRVPTVAAPEEVIRFAAALLEAPMFHVAEVDAIGRVVSTSRTLRALAIAHREGRLQTLGEPRAMKPGVEYLAPQDPLANALLRRILPRPMPKVRDTSPAPVARPLQRVTRDRLRTIALPGGPTLIAAIDLLQHIDAAVSAAAGLGPWVITVHQDLYGPDEMAHTDGSGISVNLGSVRIRCLLLSALSGDDDAAFGALVNLVLHEKAHVALACFVPRPNAEHGATFYRQKDVLRRCLLEALAKGTISNPAWVLPALRRQLGRVELPAPALLATALRHVTVAA